LSYRQSLFWSVLLYPSRDRDKAAFHVVAGWLARAEGNLAEQEEQFAAAVKKEPTNVKTVCCAAPLRCYRKENSARRRRLRKNRLLVRFDHVVLTDFTHFRIFPRNLEPDFTHYLCEQRKENGNL
jgi:hypothetical protein